MNNEISELCANLAKIIAADSDANETRIAHELEQKIESNYGQYLCDQADTDVIIRALHFLSKVQYFTREKPSAPIYLSMLDLLIDIVFPMVVLEGKSYDFLDDIISGAERVKKAEGKKGS